MKLAQKAQELGITARGLRMRCENQPGYLGSVKNGKEWVFPDDLSDTRDAREAELDIIPCRDDFDSLTQYFGCLKAREEFLKLKQARAVSSGKLVARADLEASYARTFTAIQKAVLALPGKLKNRVGEDITERAEEVLEGLCEELLHTVADDGQAE